MHLPLLLVVLSLALLESIKADQFLPFDPRLDTKQLRPNHYEEEELHEHNPAGMKFCRAWGPSYMNLTVAAKSIVTMMHYDYKDWAHFDLPGGRRTWSVSNGWNRPYEAWNQCNKECLIPAMTYGFDKAYCHVRSGIARGLGMNTATMGYTSMARDKKVCDNTVCCRYPCEGIHGDRWRDDQLDWPLRDEAKEIMPCGWDDVHCRATWIYEGTNQNGLIDMVQADHSPMMWTLPAHYLFEWKLHYNPNFKLRCCTNPKDRSTCGRFDVDYPAESVQSAWREVMLDRPDYPFKDGKPYTLNIRCKPVGPI